MGSKLTILVFVLLAVVQIIAQVIQKTTKKQQQEKMRQMAERRRQTAAGQTGAPSATATAPMSSSTTPGPGRSRLEDLAARRKAQLEELRRRRTARPSGGPVQTRVGGPTVTGPSAAPPAPTPTPTRARDIKSIQAGFRGVREAEKAEQRRRDAEARRRANAEEVRARREQQERQQRLVRERAERERAREQEARKRRPVDAMSDAYETRQKGSVRSSRVGKVLKNRAALRDLFILKELLDPPVSMRSGPDQGEP